MESLQRAIAIVGSQSVLADALGVVQSAVAGWMKRGVVPVKYCATIERMTRGQVTRKDLRPDDWRDIWPELVDADPAKPVPLALGVPAGCAISSEALQPVGEAA